MLRSKAIVRWMGVALALAAGAARPVVAFDLSGTWEVRSERCRGYGSSTSLPNPFKQKRQPGANAPVAISQSGARLNVSFPRASLLFGADLFSGFALDPSKSSPSYPVIESQSVGALVACGGLPEDLMGAPARTELGSFVARQSRRGATLKLDVKYVQFGFESGMHVYGNHVYDCSYTLRRVDEMDPGVPACP